jgi:hypothetical protein
MTHFGEYLHHGREIINKSLYGELLAIMTISSVESKAKPRAPTFHEDLQKSDQENDVYLISLTLR